MSNPYTLVFGQPPLEIIERTAQAERIINEFSQEKPSDMICLVTGIRGSGKTVFMDQIANRIREMKNWIVVDPDPQEDLLVSLAAKLDEDRNLNRLFRVARINLSAFGLGTGIRGVPPVDDIEDALEKMLKIIKRNGKRVLITIDDFTYSREIKKFAGAYQNFLREDLPAFLLMTGSCKNIDGLKNADGMEFFANAPETAMAPLNYKAIVKKYMETLELKEDTATKLAKLSNGYPFAFQAIGYYVYEDPDDLAAAVADAKDYVCEFTYWRIWSELSAKDKEIVLAIAKVPTGEIIKIRELLQYTSNQFNPYRKRLLRSGVITSPSNGIVQFALPWFGEFAQSAQ